MTDPQPNLDEQRGIELLSAFADACDARGLPLPPVPETMLDALRLRGLTQAGSRDDPTPGAYNIHWFIDEAVANRAPDYVLFGEDGHGLNSHGFHWYLVAGPLAVFVQVAYGGLYSANGIAAARLSICYDAARELIDAVLDAADTGHLAADERIVVIDSFTAGQRWARHRAGTEPVWHLADDPIAAARDGLLSQS